MQCAWDDCELPSKSSYSNSKSKYCQTHAAEARDRFMANKADADLERENRYAKFAKLWKQATEVGAKAFDDAIPTPMVVQQHANLFDDNSEVVKQWNVSEGVCGFGWLQAYPANSSFSHWAKKNLGARKGYPSGLHISLPFGRSSQSLARKEAGAYAMAEVLREGLEELGDKTKVYGQSRID